MRGRGATSSRTDRPAHEVVHTRLAQAIAVRRATEVRLDEKAAAACGNPVPEGTPSASARGPAFRGAQPIWWRHPRPLVGNAKHQNGLMCPADLLQQQASGHARDKSPLPNRSLVDACAPRNSTPAKAERSRASLCCKADTSTVRPTSPIRQGTGKPSCHACQLSSAVR